MKDFPDYPAKAVGNCPCRFGVSETGKQTPENDLELAIFLPDGSMTELVE
jgi:hypothetical protein